MLKKCGEVRWILFQKISHVAQFSGLFHSNPVDSRLNPRKLSREWVGRGRTLGFRHYNKQPFGFCILFYRRGVYKAFFRTRKDSYYKYVVTSQQPASMAMSQWFCTQEIVLSGCASEQWTETWSNGRSAPIQGWTHVRYMAHRSC